jgi:hypothetical protein
MKYINAETLPLPTISFPNLKDYGIKLLDLTSENFKKAKK